MKSWFQAIVPKDYPIDRFFENPYFLGSVEHEGHVVAYFDRDDSVARFLEGLNLSVITENDWEEKWREYFRPLAFAGFTIVPPWLSAEGDLIINPGRGFGTGHHETTRMAATMVMELLETTDSKTVLDVGTGSGVLAIAAKKKQPSIIAEGIDNDPEAIENAVENLEHNRMTGMVQFSLTPLASYQEPFDIVIANIISGTLIELRDQLVRITGRYLILSGVLVSERDSFLDAMHLCEFSLKRETVDGEWTAFLLERRHG